MSQNHWTGEVVCCEFTTTNISIALDFLRVNQTSALVRQIRICNIWEIFMLPILKNKNGGAGRLELNILDSILVFSEK